MRNPFRIPQPHGMTRLPQQASEAFRKGDLFSALIIFDYLSRSSALWKPWFQLGIRRCIKQICEVNGKRPLLNTKKHTKRGITMRFIDTMVTLGHPRDQLVAAIESVPESSHRALLLACLAAGADMKAWAMHLNEYLGHHKLRPFRLDNFPQDGNVLDVIRFQPEENGTADVENGALVTVFISAFNCASTLRYAIRSVLEQDYPNFELLIADDASTDGTRDIILEYAAADRRVIPLLHDVNHGTYWNRNVALQMAKGDYFTILDSDDYCHPQRIAIQVAMMRSNTKLAGVYSHWLRIERNGRLVFRNWGASYLHEAIATLMIDRTRVLPAIGYYDEVRFSADTEYVERIKRFFGSQSVKVIVKPLTLALAHSASLTAELTNGIHNYLGLSKPRRDYRKAWKQWHKKSRKTELYLEFHAADRKFPAPEVMHVHRL